MFTQTPENYQSLYGDLLYRFETSYTDDILVDIRDYESGETLAVKKFYTTSDFILNVAPIIQAYAEVATPADECGFIIDTNHGAVTIELVAYNDGGVMIDTTEPLTFTLSRNCETAPTLLTTFAQQRLISPGERDVLTILASAANTQITSIVRRYAESSDDYYTLLSTSTYNSTTDVAALAVFGVAVDDDDTCDKIVVSILQSGSEIAAITYFVVESPTSAMRLAWISSRGGVEHYSFAEVKSRAVAADGDRITLLSAYETYETREAIAEMIASSQVWLFAGGEYYSVEVVSSSIDTAPLEEIALVEVCVELEN